MDVNPSPQNDTDQSPEPAKPGGSRRNTRPLDREQKNWLQWAMTRKGRIALTVASVVMLAVAIAGGWYFLSQRGSGTSQDLDSPPPASLSELAKEYPELENILQDEKLDSVYKEFMLVYQEDGGEAAYELAQKTRPAQRQRRSTTDA